MAVRTHPNVPEPAMPWARELTQAVNELLGSTNRVVQNSVSLGQQIGSTVVLAGAAKTTATEAGAAAATAQERAEAPVIDADLALETLTIWPFVPQAIPGGSFATGAVKSSDIADFALTAKKFNTNRHQIY